MQENFEAKRLNDILQDVEFLKALLRGGLCIFGASGCGKTVLARELVKTLATKGIIFRIIDPSRAWLDMGEVVEVSKRQTVYSWDSSTTIFDVSCLNVGDKVNFANAFCGSLLASHIDGNCRNEIIVLEESELYLQNSTMRSKKCENIATLVSMGRNYNLRYIAISQAPALLDKLFLKLTELKFYGFLSEPNDLNYLKKMLGKTWVEQIATLGIGTFIFQNRRTIQKVKAEIEKPQENLKAIISKNCREGKTENWYEVCMNATYV